MKKIPCVAAMAVAVLASARAGAEPSCTAVSRSDDAFRGRRTAQTPILPTNPVLHLAAGRRDAAGQSATNWYATLDQQVEVAGQRSARLRAADLALQAQGHRVVATRREVASLAWLAYFDALAAAEELRLTTRLSAVSAQIAGVARGMAERGVVSPIEADVADAARVSIDQSQLAAERRAHTSQATLTVLLGADSSLPVAVTGDLEPLRGVEEEARSRIPNLTVSAFVQNDGLQRACARPGPLGAHPECPRASGRDRGRARAAPDPRRARRGARRLRYSKTRAAGLHGRAAHASRSSNSRTCTCGTEGSP